ncbi:MAG: CehA/McbA family metallohydrolase [Symbiobacteriaceae bacterium]|nr:CehA/McbA family metallohydrolase [Symbiobacteriaceae bacterium]
MNASVVYSLPDDSIPALKMEITLKNDGTSDYNGFFEYLFDPDESSEQVSYTPGVGYTTTKSTYIAGGWTENYLFNGPNGRSSTYTAHTIVWPNDQQPTGLVNEGYISGVWFAASIPVGESQTYIIYHVMTVPQTNEPYAEAAYYANILSHGENAGNRTLLSGRVVDAETGEGLPYVKVVAKYAVGDKSGQTGGTAITGANGTYAMLVEKDVYTLTSTVLRYKQGSLSIDLQGTEPELNFELQLLEGTRVLRDVPLNSFGSGVECVANDFVLENDLFAFSLVDTGNDPQIPIPFTRGRILDMSTFEASYDGIDWLYTSWLTNRPVTGEQWNRYTTRFDTIEVTKNTPEESVVTATGVYDETLQANPNARTCDVVQVASIKPGDYYFTLDTTITNVSGGSYALYAGDLIDYDFGGAQRAYSPGVEEYTADRFYTGLMTEPWIAGYGSGAGAAKQTYGIVYDELWPGEQMTAFGYNRWIGAYRYITLEDGESFTYSRRVAIVPNADYENPWDAIGALYSGTGNALDVSVEFDNKLYQVGDMVTVTVNINNLSDLDLENLNIGVTVPYQLVGTGENKLSFPILTAGDSIRADFSYRAIEGGRGNINYLVTSGQIRMRYTSAISISGAGWYGGDNHSHTTYSDGSGSVKDNTDAAYAQGLSWLYSTDHNTVNQRVDTQTITNNSRGDFFSITGNEITTSIGHALGYQIPYNTGGLYNTSLNRMPSTGRTWQTVIDEVNRDGGFFYVAHPNYPGLEFPDVYNIRNYSGLEVWNGFYHAIDPDRNVSIKAFLYWDEINSRGEAKYFGIANSDGHNPDKQADPYSIGYMDSLSLDNIHNILRNGKFFGTNGPQLRFDIDGVSYGETLKIEGSSRTAKVTIAAFDELYPLTTVTLYKLSVTGSAVNTREIISSWDLRGQNLHSWTETFALTVTEGEFYRVEIASTTGTTGNGGAGTGSGTGFAFSNPIWIESTTGQTNDIVIDNISINASRTELRKGISGSYYAVSAATSSLTADDLSVTLSGNSTVASKRYDAVNKVFHVTITAEDGTVKDMSIYVLDDEVSETVPFAAETLTLTPGSTAEDMNFTWYSDRSDANHASSVKIAEKAKMNGKSFPVDAIIVEGILGDATPDKSWHKVSIMGLEQDTEYVYCVSNDKNTYSEIYEFKTGATSAFTFAVVGDPQLTTGNQDATSNYKPDGEIGTTKQGWQDTMSVIASKGVDFIAGVGDQVDVSLTTNEAEYANFFAPAQMPSIPFAPAVGNHDRHDGFAYHYNLPNEQLFAPLTGPDYGNPSAQQAEAEARGNYFYSYNNALFVVLNTSSYPTSTVAAAAVVARFDATLAAAVAAYPDYDWLFVQHHKSTSSVADHIADRDIQYYVEAGFEKLMDKYGVDFVLAGHDHVYARSYPMHNGVPDKTGASGQPNVTLIMGGDGASEAVNPKGTVYFTTTTGSGLKYYELFNNAGNLYVKDNIFYPYLVNDLVGSVEYMKGNLPLSAAKYLQNKTPGFIIVQVEGNTVSFAYYDLSEDYLNTPYDTYTVTKTDEIMTHTVTFNADNDTENIVVTVEDGEKVTPPATPVKARFDFIGWYLEGEVFDFDTKITGDITLTARWEEDFGAIYCEICGEKMTFGEVAGNCYANGYSYYGCTCGYWYYVEIFETIGHDLAHVEKDGQWFKVCTKDGCGYWEYAEAPVIEVLCDVCGLPMTFGEVAGNCYANGYSYYGCTCGYWYYVEIFKTIGHHLVLVETRPATCEHNGAEFYACDKEGCNHWEYGKIIPALGHDLAHVEKDGQWFKVCQNDGCNYWEYAEAPVIEVLCDVCGLPMAFGEVAGNCYANGYSYYGCTCGYWYYVEIFKTIGHHLVLVETRPATCEHNGAEFYACDKEGCNHWEYGKIIPAFGHDLAHVEKDGQWFKVCQNDGCNYWDYAAAPIPELLTITSVGSAKFISIDASSKTVYELKFSVNVVYSDGSSKVVQYSVFLNGNNANQSGSYKFEAGHDLAGYTLTYDIKGNGSNIKEFKITQ